MVEWIKHRKGHYYCVVNCKNCNKKVKSSVYSENIVCKKCFKKAVKEVENKKRCSKCGKEVFMSLYVERKTLFGLIKRKYCFSCYNKLKNRAGTMELKELTTIGVKDNSTSGEKFIGNNMILPSTPPKRIQIPKEDIILEPYTKLSGISDDKVDNGFNIPIEMASDIHSDSNVEILSIKKSNIYTGQIKNKKNSKQKLSTLKIIDLSTRKDISEDMEIQIHLDKDSKPLKEMKAKCFECGNNIGFKNIPSELCLECSVYDIEKSNNKFKPKKEVKNNT